jgi:hypothetical protein
MRPSPFPCGACARRALCTPQNRMERHGRAVSREVEPEAMVRYHAKMETAEAKAIYKQRAPMAEFPNAWLKTKLKWVRSQCRGLRKEGEGGGALGSAHL